MGSKNVNKIPVRVRLEKPLADALDVTAHQLQTTRTWVVSTALLEFLKHMLPPGFTLGKPVVEDDNESDE